jgi:hypothetical protein
MRPERFGHFEVLKAARENERSQTRLRRKKSALWSKVGSQDFGDR